MGRGIVERFGEPRSWWLNHDEVLTESVTSIDVAQLLGEYDWLWREAGLRIPIDPRAFYAVAVEANGNVTIAGRSSGELLLFAPDHSFTGVTPLPGCPPFSLISIDELPTLSAWLEYNAEAWSRDQ